MKVEKAVIGDVPQIHQLVNHFADKGEMLPRALFGHNIKEYANLAAVLPEIYAEEKDNW